MQGFNNEIVHVMDATVVMALSNRLISCVTLEAYVYHIVGFYVTICHIRKS